MTTVNTVAPVLAPIGAPVGTSFNYVGGVLSCTTGTWTTSAVTSYAYAWQRAGSAISGATSQLYTLSLADVGQSISCNITATGAETVFGDRARASEGLARGFSDDEVVLQVHLLAHDL